MRLSGMFDRQVLLFGKEGQTKLASASVAIVGIGGLGTHVVQQLAYLGVTRFSLIDDEDLQRSNMNRYIGARHDDKIVGTWKVDIGERLVRAINPEAAITKVRHSLVSAQAFDTIKSADLVFGCLDNEGSRLVLNELCSAYNRPYIDLGTEIDPDGPRYGGRVVVTVERPGCVLCLDQLDVEEAGNDLADSNRRAERDALYGLKTSQLGAAPSVVSINGVVASLAVTEGMCILTGLRLPVRLLTYRGNTGGVGVNKDEPTANCPACSLGGLQDQAGIESYIQRGVLQRA